MQVPQSGASLRPLGLGEILDRAVNLCVRFFMPLAAIYLWYAVPLGIISYFSSAAFTRAIAVFSAGAQTGHPATQEQIMQALQSQPADIGWALLAFAFGVFVAPLPTAALIEAVAAFYLGRSSSVGQAYRVGLDRYLNMLGITLLFVLTAVALYVLLAVVVFVAVLAIVAVAAGSKIAALVIGIVLGLVAIAILIAFVVVFLFVLQLAYFSCVVERANAVAAYGRSFKRAFSGIGLPRTLLVGLIYLAIAFGIGLVSFAGESLVVGLLHSPALGAVYQTIVRLATAAFTTAFIGVFYLDLRVREEGLDLQLATDRVEAPAISAT